MNLQNKTDLLLDALEIEDIDLDTAEQIINLASDLANQTGRVLAKVYNESTGMQSVINAISQVLNSPGGSDSRKLKTIIRILASMPENITKAVTESNEEKRNRIFRS